MRPTHAELHYSDGMHCWIPPWPDISDEAWRAVVRAHMEDARRAGGCAEALIRAVATPRVRKRPAPKNGPRTAVTAPGR